MNSRSTTLLALAYALLCAALMLRRAEVAWMAAPLLGALLAAHVRAWRAGAVRLAARRTVERDRGGGIQVAVTVRNQGASPVHLRLDDLPRPPVQPTDGSTALAATLAPGEETALRYSFRVPRGRFAWAGVRAAAGDALGLVDERLELPTPGEIHVHPEAVRFRPIPLQPGRTLPSPGSIPARVGGSGTEFFGVREYHVGDALRWIDWRLTARHRGKLFTKEFEQEQIADVGLVLDGRVSVERDGGDSLCEHGVRATASLATTFLRQGNRVGLLVLGETDARVFPGCGRVHRQRILSCLAGVQGRASTPSGVTGHSFARMFPARSIVIVLTPLLTDDTPLLLRLKAHGRRVVVVSPDPIEFRAAAVPQRDQVSRLALRAARVERQLALRALAHLQFAVVDWQVERPLYPLVRAVLRPRRGGRPT